jgi:catechol 2,3-dioxygenase-like lactoylglutathione lyase family enzyme
MSMGEKVRGDIKLSAIRLFAKDAAKTAKFYEALGYEILGPNLDELEKMGIPLFIMTHTSNQGVEIDILQLAPGEQPVSGSRDTTLCIRVGDIEHVVEEVRSRGLFAEAHEPNAGQRPLRISWAQGLGLSKDIGLLRDPDGRLVYLELWSALGGPNCALQTKPFWEPVSTSGTAYYVGQQVTFEGEIYLCIRDHIADPDKTPPQLPEWWQHLGTSRRPSGVPQPVL